MGTGAKDDERQVLTDILTGTPLPAADHRPTLIGDKNFFGAAFEDDLAAGGITLLRPTRKGERPRGGEPFFKPLRQIIESVNDTFKGQLDLN